MNPYEPTAAVNHSGFATGCLILSACQRFHKQPGPWHEKVLSNSIEALQTLHTTCPLQANKLADDC